jgi:hypothetical protein
VAASTLTNSFAFPITNITLTSGESASNISVSNLSIIYKEKKIMLII